MYFVTVILCSLLLRSGLGELPEECPVEAAGGAVIQYRLHNIFISFNFNDNVLRTAVAIAHI